MVLKGGRMGAPDLFGRPRPASPASRSDALAERVGRVDEYSEIIRP